MKVEDSTLVVVRALERLGVRHYVTGSIASSLHGDPRATNDADLVAALSPFHFERLKKELGDRFYVDEEDFLHAVKEERSFNLIDELELAKVDVFCVAVSGYQREALDRAVTMELERDDPFTFVKVASASDVVLSKLRWYRLGGETSDRQWRDLLGVDLEYLRRWSREQGTLDLLDRLLETH
jgi:predicted nucleotidyltransferase